MQPCMAADCQCVAPMGLHVRVLNMWSYHFLIWCLHNPTKHYPIVPIEAFVWLNLCIVTCLLSKKHIWNSSFELAFVCCLLSFVDLADSHGLSLCFSFFSAPFLHQSPPCSVLCSGLWSFWSRYAHAGRKPLDRLPGCPQHLSLHLLLHTTQEAQHHQHLGGSISGCDTSYNGLDGCYRRSGLR